MPGPPEPDDRTSLDADALAAARERETQLRMALEMTGLGTFVWHVDEDRTEADARTRAHLGQPEDADLSLRAALASVVRPDSREQLARGVAHALATAGEAALYEEIAILRPDGSERWIAITGRTLRSAETGRVERVVGTVADVTERQQAQDALRENVTHQGFLLKLSDALRPLEDPAEIEGEATRLLGEHLHVNRAIYAEVDGDVFRVRRSYASGVAPVEATSPIIPHGDNTQDFYRLTGPLAVDDVATNPHLTEVERAALAGLSVAALAGVTLVKDGRWVAAVAVHSAGPRAWTQADLNVIAEVGERIWSAVERAEARAALRESESKYRSLFETMSEGFGVGELVRDESGRAIDFIWVELNPSIERLTGSRREDLIGHRASEVLPGLEGWPLRRCAAVVETGEPDRFDLYIEQIDRWLNCWVSASGGDRFAVLYDDVTERKRAEEVLRRSEARQTLLLKLSDALRPLGDPAAIKREASQVLREHLGAARVTYSEMVGEGDILVTESDAAPGAAELSGRHHLADFGATLAAEFLNGAALATADVTIDAAFTDAERGRLLAIGSRAWCAVPLVKEGRLVALLGASCGTTHAWTDEERALIEEVAERTWAAVERARAEASLRESESRYRTLFESIDEGFCLVELDHDADGRAVDYTILDFNPAFGRHTGTVHPRGRSQRELIGDEVARTLDLFARVASSGGPLRAEEFDPITGRWFTFYASRVGGEGSRQVAVVFNDITQQRELEEATRRSEERLREALIAGRMASFTWDPETDRVRASETAAEVLGLRPGETIEQGALAAALTHPEDVPRRRATVTAATAGSGSWQGEFRIIRPRDGQVAWIEERLHSRRDPVTGKIEITSLIWDVTERKRQEEARERLAVAEAVAAERQALLRRIVSGQEDERRRMTSEIQESVNQAIVAAAWRLDGLAAQLAVKLPDSDLVTVNEARDLMRQAVKDARKLIAGLRPEALDIFGLAAAIGQEVAEMEAAGFPISLVQHQFTGVRLPPEQEITLFRVAQEALENVRRYAPGARVVVELGRTDGGARLRVRDWGPGFDLASVRPAAGSGERLGLLGMRERLALCGGRLEVRSRVGHGTTITATVRSPEQD